MTIKRGRKILLTEKELRFIEKKRNNGLSWNKISEKFDCSESLLSKRYKKWLEADKKLPHYLRLSVFGKLKLILKKLV
jgi:AraC-like DNA-binding protein